MQPTTTLFIDLDGTIMENPFLSAVFPYLTDALAPKLGMNADVLSSEFIVEQESRLRQPDVYSPTMTMDWDDIVETVIHRYGYELPRTVCELVSEYSRPPYIYAIDDSPAVLRELKQASHRRLVVASNGLSKYQLPVMKALGLTPLFHDFLMPDLAGYLKTEEGFYRRYAAQEARGLFISVGDNYTHDVICPKRFGFHAIYKIENTPDLADLPPFARCAYLPPVDILPDAVILSLDELPAVIAAIEASAA